MDREFCDSSEGVKRKIREAESDLAYSILSLMSFRKIGEIS